MTSPATRTRRATVLRGTAADGAPVAGREVTPEFDRSAQRMHRNAAEVVEDARRVAFDQGYAEGLDAARADIEAATADANKRVRRSLAALCAAIDAFEVRETTALADVEDAVVTGAFQLAGAVLQRELAVAADPGGEAIARALRLAPARGDVVARLHPDDAATLGMGRVATRSRAIEVVADDSVEPGGCVLEVGETEVDAQLSAALANIASALDTNPQLVIGVLVAPRPIELPAPTATENSSETAGRSRKTSRKTASEAPLS